MKNTKTNKGITLVALIITIVILMVLAGVAIISIQNDGILAYAQNASTTWNSAQKNEAGIIGGYEQYLNNMENGENIEGDTNGGNVDNCKHQYENSLYDTPCSLCNFTCSHSNKGYSSLGVCDTCGRTCNHDYDYHIGCCNICNYECPHYGASAPTYQFIPEEGKHIVLWGCSDCGMNEDYPWGYDCNFVNGVCTTCKGKCPHPDIVGLECTICGEYTS